MRLQRARSPPLIMFAAGPEDDHRGGGRWLPFTSPLWCASDRNCRRSDRRRGLHSQLCLLLLGPARVLVAARRL